ncbi:MAG: MBL fold metallo-hydrolase [bacterium]
MIIEKLEVGVFAENCYLVGCEKTHQGVVIDPGDEIPRILSKINDMKLDITSILLTHAHLDHVKELNVLREQITVPVLMHSADEFLLENLQAQAAAFGLAISGIPKVDRYVVEGDSIEIGHLSFEVLHTPGHSPGSVSYVATGVAFVGDILFAGSIGRTDLPGGDYATLIDSIKTKLYPLGDDTMIYPGHGPHTTLGQEKQSNPFLVA